MPYKENEVYGPNYPKLAPDLIEGQEEFEVEAIVRARCFGQWKTLQYLIKWKGYSKSDNSWEAVANVTNAKDAIVDFYHRHPRAVREMEASILALTIELVYNKAEEEDQIRKKLEKHPIGRRLLSTGLAIPLIMEAIHDQMIQLKKWALNPQSTVSPSRINDRGVVPKKRSLDLSQSEPQQEQSNSSNWWSRAYQELQKQMNRGLAWLGKRL